MIKMKSLGEDPASNRMRRGQMDELTGRLAVRAGVSGAVAENIIGIIPGFLRSEGYSHNVQALIYRMGRLRQVVHGFFARELFRFGRDKIGTDGTAGIIASTPDLGQFA
jgi:hypothetical protein